MAILKDLIVHGVSRFISDIFADTIHANKFSTNNGTSSQFVKGDGTLDSNTYATTSQLPSLPLSIANGGTGATTKKAAEYAINGGMSEASGEPADSYQFVFSRTSDQSATNGVFLYRTAATIWSWIKNKISSVLGIGGSNGVPTAPTAAAGTNTTQIATTAFVQNATSGTAIDTNVVHKTGNETIAGVKTFTDNVILEDTPTQGSHAANKEYVDNADNSVFLNGATANYKIYPYSLCAFAIWNGGTWMAMTSFTNVGGTGNKTALSEVKFPIGCKIYYHPDSEEAPAVTSFYHKKFYTSYKSVDARYSAITGSNVSLGNQNCTSVYLMVSVDGYYWSPYYKEGSSEEIIVSPDNFESGNYYIYLGKKSTLTINGYEFQLEDNNILYYFDGDDLIDWASYIANVEASSVSQDLSGKADKVSNATSGNFAALDSNGNLTDSGHKHSDYLTSHQDLSNYVQKSQTAGLLKNDGTVDTNTYITQHQDISGKADKVVYVDASTPPSTMDANKVYQYGTLSGNTTFPAFTAVASGDTEVKIWCWTFTTPSTAPTITWPAGITAWNGGSAPTINASKLYEVSVMDGLACIIESKRKKGEINDVL